MSDPIRIGLLKDDFDVNGDAMIHFIVPNGTVIAVLIPDCDPETWPDWMQIGCREYGLNFVTKGHYE